MYKLITCDLDETLLNKNGKVCQQNKEAIQLAIAAGVKFVPSTGRGFNDIQDILSELGIKEIAGEYVSSFNGGCITENKSNKILYFRGFDFKRAKELFNFGKQFNVCVQFYTDNFTYLYNVDQEEYSLISQRIKCKVINDEFDIDVLSDQNVPKIILANPDLDYLKTIVAEHENQLSDIEISYSSNRYLELNPAGVNKGESLKYLVKMLDINICETIAIGDNLNDLSMIKAAGLGVGVNNSASEIKPYLDYLTKADNNQGGVAEVIEKFVLND